MAESEKTPLLTAPATLPLYPPFISNGVGQQLPPYGVVEVVHHNIIIPDKPRQPGGIASTPIVALIALGIALFLIFSVTLSSHDQSQVINPVSLGQSAGSPDVPLEGYKDITIPQGVLRGFTKKSRQGRNFTAYYRVPYAEPPIGDLRFKDPINPRGGWEGVRAMQIPTHQCIQKGKYIPTIQAVGEEDCLYSNIYVPDIDTTSDSDSANLLPVMVYIHGGEFVDGNGSRYKPDYFMDEDVIIITFEWRLGAFGFLSTGDDVIRGNMGYKDQVQMLQWTKDNIQHFGGDPQRITVFGNSGGGMSVGLLMLSPMAKGLFQRAISQSGSSLCVVLNNILNKNPETTKAEVGRVLGCDSSDSTAFLECLRTKNAADIALVRTPDAKYGLSREGHSNQAQIYIPDDPYTVLTSDPNRAPYMIGMVSDEWAGNGVKLLSNEPLIQSLNENWNGVADKVLNLKDVTSEEISSIKDFYFGTKPVSNDTFWETNHLVGDRFLNHCIYISGILQSQFSPTYLYYLSKSPHRSYVDKDFPGFPAKEYNVTAHGDELQFFFLYDQYPEIKTDDAEYFEFSKYLVSLWATFASDGAPAVEWAPVMTPGSNSTFWFELSDNPGRTEVLTENMGFWDGFTHKQLSYDVK